MSKSKAGVVCAARNCKNKTYNCNLSFFSFPKDETRAQMWLSACGREDLKDRMDKLHSYRLCASHFENKMYLNDLKNRLLPNVVPTIFKCLEEFSSSSKVSGILDMQHSARYYKYCIIRKCKNTTVTAPEKIYIRIPEESNRRKQWLKVCTIDPDRFPSRSRAHVCEDHFNLEEDMENYVKFKLAGGKLILKANVVPHIFECQQVTTQVSTSLESSPATKWIGEKTVNDTVTSTSFVEYTASKNTTSTSPVIVHNALEETSSFPTIKTEVAEVTHRDIGILVRPQFSNKYVQSES